VAQTQAAAEQQLREAKQQFEVQAAEARRKADAAVKAAVAAAETALARRLEDQRRALEKATVEAINAEKAKAFADRQKTFDGARKGSLSFGTWSPPRIA
jgi:hypothetical protein